MAEAPDGLDGVLDDVRMGYWQILAFVLNCLVWSVLAPHTIGTTLLNAPVDFKCLPYEDPYFSPHWRNGTDVSSLISPGTTVLPSVIEDIITTTRGPISSNNITAATTTLVSANEVTTTLAPNSTETTTDPALEDDITTIGPSGDVDTVFDNKCFDSPPMHILPGIYDTENTSWVVDDKGHLHKLQPWEEYSVRQANAKQEILVEIAVPSCPKVQYDHSVFESTVTTEWHLICGKELERPLFQNTYTLGIIFGCILGGDIADRLGRVMAIKLFSILHVIFSVVVAFTANYTALLVARFFVGLTNLGILVPAVTLALETCPGHLRGPIGMAVGIPYSVGVIAFGGLGYLIRHWRYLYMATSFPAFIMVPVSFFLDESPRWLLQRGKLTEAKAVLLKAFRRNKSSAPPEDELDQLLMQISQSEEQQDTKSLTVAGRITETLKETLSFVRTPAMRRISIVLPINWIFSELLYYGIIFNANNFSETNPFVYVLLTGVSDALAILLGTPIAKKFGRRNTIGAGQIGAGLLTILVLIIPENLRWLQWIFVMFGFLCSAAAAQVLYVYTPELYPTTLRSRGFAFCNLTGYVGTFIAPFIPEVLAKLAWWITDVSLGLAGLIAGLIILSLPETNKLPLCETIEDVEERAVNKRKRKEEEKQNKKDAKKDESVDKEEPQKNMSNGIELNDMNNTAGEGKKSDADIVKDIIISNAGKFIPNGSSGIRSSVRIKTHDTGSVNCLLECPNTLTTTSFGTRQQQLVVSDAETKQETKGSHTPDQESKTRELKWTNNSFLKEIGTDNIGFEKEKKV